MIQSDKKVLSKHLRLTALGVALQVVGNLCFIAATMVVVKEVNAQIRQALLQELTKDEPRV